MTNAKLNAQLRARVLKQLNEFLTTSGEQVLQIASGTICYPIVDLEGNEKFLKIVVSVPTADDFDGYEMAEVYTEKVKADEIKAKEKAEAKARKKKRDEEYRAKQAELKEKRENGEGAQ